MVARISCNGVAVWISESEPEVNLPCSLWFNDSTNHWFKRSGDTWEEIPIVTTGITGTKTLGGYKFTFTNGLLTGFEPV